MNILIGHLVGDILFQNRWLAMRKHDRWWGMLLHCAVASGFVALVCGWFDYRAFLAFASHWLIDTYGLGKSVWPKLIGQGNPKNKDACPEWLGLLDDQSLHLVSYWLITLI